MTPSATELLTVAVVARIDGDEAQAIERRMTVQGRSVRWVVPRDLDLVDRDVREGRVNRVIFGQCGDLLAGIWNGDVSFAAWRDTGVQVEFVESPGEDSAALLATVAHAWTRYRLAQRRRRLIGGVILSLIAVVAAFAIVWFGR
jgi:hypothetical protein